MQKCPGRRASVLPLVPSGSLGGVDRALQTPASVTNAVATSTLLMRRTQERVMPAKYTISPDTGT